MSAPAANGGIPAQAPLSWAAVAAVSWAGVRRRFLRSLVTVTCVVLAIAFVAYMLSMDALTAALVQVNDPELNGRLQEHGVDILAVPGADRMTWLLLGLAVLTCTVGIVNAMLMSVTERVREIGTLKCLGARDAFIVKTYFLESALQGVFGALIGALAGGLIAVAVMGAAYGRIVLAHFPAGAVWSALGGAFGCGLVIAVVSAIWPAYAAARKEPVEALRVEE